MAQPLVRHSESISAGSPSRNRWASFADLIRLRSQSGTMLLMLPTLWSLVLASDGRPPLNLLFVFMAGSFLMRSAGVVLNDLADRSFDRQVARTRARPLASGAVTVNQALALVSALIGLVVGLVLLLNPLAILLSPVALALAALYPYAKRVIHVPQAALGLAFGWGVVMAWAAARNSLAVPAWLLYGSTFCWAVAYDTIYALQDREDDLRIGVKSAAILFGSRTWIAVGIAFGVMLTLLVIAGWLTGLGLIYYGVLAVVGGFFARQMVMLRGPITPPEAFALFKQHVWVGWAVLTGMWLGFL